jgi:hypothetical protein
LGYYKTWKIDTSYINESDDPPKAEAVGEYPTTFPDPTRFRLLDDDRLVYFEGVLDGGHENAQIDALEWGKKDAGCTIIEVLRDNQWRMEIGC